MRKFSLTRRHSGLGDLVPQQISFLQGWNRRWYAPNALLVYVPETQAELVEAVTEAINGFGGNVKVTSGGHCYENFVYNDDTQAIINLSALNRVGYDASRGYYVDAGAENWNVYKTLLMSYNLTIPAGSCYAVGAGGHISGGGYGLLSRLHGLTIDHVTGVDIVVKTGSGNAELIYVSAAAGLVTDEQNLFWALRGGGPGNFGAIARFYFETLPVAPNRAIISAFATPWLTSSGSLAFSEADLTALTTWWAEDMASQEENTWSEFGLLHLNHIANGEISYTKYRKG